MLDTTLLNTIKFMAKQNKTEKVTGAPEVSGAEAEHTLTVYGDNPLELIMPDNMPESDYLAFGSKIGKAMEFVGWRIGDYVNFGMTRFGYKDYEKISTVTGLSEQYLRSCSSVAANIPVEYRGQHSLEKCRLMLSRKDKDEKVPHLIRRLGNKTVTELRDLSKSAPPGPHAATTATQVYDAANSLFKAIDNFDTGSKEKLAALATFEQDKESGGVLAGLAGLLKMLIEQINDKIEK
jgi:hypothetical protein